MKRFFLHLAYNGTRYHGWQIQPDAVSVQEELEKCLGLKIGEKVSITGCGRTDTGVHARNFYAHFDTEKNISDCDDFVNKLNIFLPIDIVVYKCWEVDSNLHARFDAKSRTYHYQITRIKNPFHTDDAYYYYGHLDIKSMQEAANALFDYTDFTSFSKLHTQVKTNNCKIMKASFFEKDDLLIFEIKADRFLRNMVRAVIGTLLEVGRGKMTLEQFREVIEKKNRCSAGTSMPAHALFLENVEY